MQNPHRRLQGLRNQLECLHPPKWAGPVVLRTSADFAAWTAHMTKWFRYDEQRQRIMEERAALLRSIEEEARSVREARMRPIHDHLRQAAQYLARTGSDELTSALAAAAEGRSDVLFENPVAEAVINLWRVLTLSRAAEDAETGGTSREWSKR